MSEVSKKELHLGDKVKVVGLQSEHYRGDCEVGIGDTGVITDIDEGHVLKYYVESDEGDSWWWEEENLELVKEEETMSEQTHKTPYQEKGYTENSLFKFVGEYGQFDKGEILKLHYDDGDDCPDFKSTSRDRKRYCCLYEVEYIGEEGAEDMLPDYKEVSKKLYSPLDVQQAGDHYKKRGIQPIEYGLANDLAFPQVNIVKYVTRHEDKNGLDDLAKSIHYHFFEALRVYGEEGSDELRKKVLALLNVKETNHG